VTDSKGTLSPSHLDGAPALPYTAYQLILARCLTGKLPASQCDAIPGRVLRDAAAALPGVRGLSVNDPPPADSATSDGQVKENLPGEAPETKPLPASLPKLPPPACLVSNRMQCPVNLTVRNIESGWAYEQVPFDLPLPDDDLAQPTSNSPSSSSSSSSSTFSTSSTSFPRFTTCALVGNGASILKQNRKVREKKRRRSLLGEEELKGVGGEQQGEGEGKADEEDGTGAGKAIDAHDAVFRFNDLMRFACFDPESPNYELCYPEKQSPPPPAPVIHKKHGSHFPPPALHHKRNRFPPPSPPANESIANEDREYAQFIGVRTTFRILNRKHGLKLPNLGAGQSIQYRPSEDESFVFWHHGSLDQAGPVSLAFPKTRIYFLSADLLDWSVNAYSALRRDMHALGAPPARCYSALSSGLHGLLLALRLCEHVDLYGFDLDLDQMYQQVHFRPIRERPSDAHDWKTDMFIYRWLHMAGKISLCME